MVPIVSRTPPFVRRLAPALLGGVAALALDPQTASPQVRLPWGIDVVTASRYEWRGITRRNAWVAQPDLFGGLAVGNFHLTAGGWMNFEFTVADTLIPAAIGLGRRIGEWNGWFEGQFHFRRGEIAAGITAYHFPNPAAAEAFGNTVFDTWELYGRVEGRPGPLALRLAGWLDVDAVDGAYLEPSLVYRIPLVPLQPVGIPVIDLGLRAGVSLGQAAQDGSENGYFAEDGLTHAELFVAPQLHATLFSRNLTLAGSVHLQHNEDPATRRASRLPSDADDRFTLWFGLRASYYRR